MVADQPVVQALELDFAEAMQEYRSAQLRDHDDHPHAFHRGAAGTGDSRRSIPGGDSRRRVRYAGVPPHRAAQERARLRSGPAVHSGIQETPHPGSRHRGPAESDLCARRFPARQARRCSARSGLRFQPQDVLHLGRRHHVPSRSGRRGDSALGGGAGARQHHRFRFRGRDGRQVHGDGGFEQASRSRADRRFERLRKTHGRRALDFRSAGCRRARVSRQTGLGAARVAPRSAARNR